MAIPVVVLNLKSSPDRRAKIGARLDALGIAHRFFDAIDGRKLPADELERLAPPAALLFNQPLKAGEIGCAASHLAAIRDIANGADAFVCTLEDDAELSSPDIARFLDPALLTELPPFDVLRFVSDPERWRMPAWPVAHVDDRGIYAMARPGWGLQGQVISRAGARKIAAQVSAIRAPIDFALYHDCHVQGLRVLEVRPGLIEHDRKLAEPALMQLSVIGNRPPPDKSRMSAAERWRLRGWRWRRKAMAVTGFFRVWGVGAFVTRVLPWWPPGTYFR